MTEIQEATGRVKKQKQARIKFKKSKEILVQKHKGKVIQGTRRQQEHKHGAEQTNQKSKMNLPGLKEDWGHDTERNKAQLNITKKQKETSHWSNDTLIKTRGHKG